jgi:tetratricopeptide (TPR) repeat protein
MTDTASDKSQKPNRLEWWMEKAIIPLALLLLPLIGNLINDWWKKDQGLTTVVSLLLIVVILLTISRIAAKYLRRLWLVRISLISAVLAGIGLVISLLIYFSPPKDILVLVADFKGAEEQKYMLTETLIDELRRELSPYDDVKVEALGRAVGEKDVDAALGEAKRRKAAILIWGRYAPTDQYVGLAVHFKPIDPPAELPELEPVVRGKLQTHSKSELNDFTLQLTLSKQMTSLTIFVAGMVHYSAGHYDRAIPYFNAVLAESTSRQDGIQKKFAYYFRGDAYHQLNQFGRSTADLSEAIRIDPRYVDAYVLRGGVYHFHVGKNEQALKDLNLAIALAPSNALAYQYRGSTQYAMNRYSGALKDYRRSIALDSSSAYAYVGLGNVYLAQKLYDRAIDYANQAMEKDRYPHTAYFLRGMAYAGKRDYDRAIKDYTHCINWRSWSPDYSFFEQRGIAYEARGDLDNAIRDYSRAIALRPDSAGLYEHRGLAYEGKRYSDRAIEDYTRAIQLQPKIPRLYERRGIVNEAKGDLALAIEDYTRAIQLEPTVAHQYEHRALAYESKGEVDRAIGDYNRAIQLQPKVPFYYEHRGYLYETKGKFDVAIADYGSAINLKPRESHYYEHRAHAYEGNREFRRAINDYTHAILLHPNGARFYVARGLAYRKVGNEAAARNDFRHAREASLDISRSPSA